LFYIVSELKLIDFGLALQVEDDEPITGRAGTPGFMAPEILDDNFPETRTGKVLIQSFYIV
jgi:serine/threonine protein kinase